MARTDTLINFLTDVAAAIKTKKGDDTLIPAANFDTEIVNLPSGGSDNTTLISLIDRTVTSFEIPERTKRIGVYAFAYCSSLASITIPDSVTSIGVGAFEFCTSLTSITIPDSVTSIGDSAFFRCTGLTSVIIGNGVTSIDSSAFRDCTGLTSITIPDSVTSIGSYVFDNTAWYNAQPFGDVYAGKVYYKYKGTMPENTSVDIKDGTKGIASIAFSGCTGLTSITIPDSVTSIGGAAFSGCTGLTSVIIGNGVTSIVDYAFSNCTNLTEIDFSTHTTVPTLNSTTAFNNTPANLVIKVPSTLLDEWKAATNWSTYADKIMGV